MLRTGKLAEDVHGYKAGAIVIFDSEVAEDDRAWMGIIADEEDEEFGYFLGTYPVKLTDVRPTNVMSERVYGYYMMKAMLDNKAFVPNHLERLRKSLGVEEARESFKSKSESSSLTFKYK